MALDKTRNWEVIPADERGADLMGVLEVKLDEVESVEAEAKDIYGRAEPYDPWRNVPHGEHFRAIEEARCRINSVAECEERARTMGDAPLHYRAAVVAAERFRRLAERYDALALALKVDLDVQPVKW